MYLLTFSHYNERRCANCQFHLRPHFYIVDSDMIAKENVKLDLSKQNVRDGDDYSSLII